ncbi:hypothetical protein V8E53_011734 [Lactarius tabidus]
MNSLLHHGRSDTGAQDSTSSPDQMVSHHMVDAQQSGFSQRRETPPQHWRDGKMVGVAAAVIPAAWHEASNHNQAYELGKGISQYNVDTFGISLAGSQSAISSIANLNLQSIQEHALNFVHVYNNILSSYADAHISIEWTPADTLLPGFCQATHQAQQECAQPTYKEIKVKNVLSATFQKQKTRAEAFEQWAQEWHTKACTSLPYHLSLPKPPDRHNHPLWAAVDKAESPPTCSTFCTMLHLAVGHSFTAKYMHRFKRDFQPLDDISTIPVPGMCPCHTQAVKKPMAPQHTQNRCQQQQMVLGQ